MSQYIATFFSHFGAIRYKKICDTREVKARVMPVPRSLSSSCGTCVGYEAEEPIMEEKYLEELEQIVKVLPGVKDSYEQVYSS